MKLDVLNFLAMTDQATATKLGLSFARETHTLSGNADIVSPIDPQTGYGKWIHVKDNAKGFPWDIKLYDDEDHVYDFVTEKSWAEGSRSYKKFVQNHYQSGLFTDHSCQP